MGNFSWPMVIIIILLFVIGIGFLLGQIQIQNPLLGQQSVLIWLFSNIGHAIHEFFSGVFF